MLLTGAEEDDDDDDEEASTTSNYNLYKFVPLAFLWFVLILTVMDYFFEKEKPILYDKDE